MKKIKWLALSMAVLMVFSSFAGCGKKDVENESFSEVFRPEEDEITAENNVSKSPNFKAVKIGEIDTDFFFTEIGKGGIAIERENGTYTLVSHDGSKVTKTIYRVCENKDKYFMVSETIPTDEKDIEGINTNGLVDVENNVIIPMEYGDINILNERYAKVIRVTGLAESKDEAISYYLSPQFSADPKNSEVYYEGIWYIYDMKEGKVIDSISVTNRNFTVANGNYISYISEDGEARTVNAEGEELDARVLENGWYYSVKDNAVYDADGDKAFTVSQDGYDIAGFDGRYFIAYNNNSGKYILLDQKGRVASSAEFDKQVFLEGELLFCDKVLYDFDGNIIFEGCEEVYFDEYTKEYYFVVLTDGTHVLIDKHGNEKARILPEEDSYVSTTGFYVCKKTENGYVYYNFADKGYTLTQLPSYLSPWLVSIDKDGQSAVVDTLSGQVVVQGYKCYSCQLTADKALYIYGKTEKGTWDIYLVKVNK